MQIPFKGPSLLDDPWVSRIDASHGSMLFHNPFGSRIDSAQGSIRLKDRFGSRFDSAQGSIFAIAGSITAHPAGDRSTGIISSV
jgi:hypothetical protein